MGVLWRVRRRDTAVAPRAGWGAGSSTEEALEQAGRRNLLLVDPPPLYAEEVEPPRSWQRSHGSTNRSFPLPGASPGCIPHGSQPTAGLLLTNIWTASGGEPALHHIPAVPGWLWLLPLVLWGCFRLGQLHLGSCWPPPYPHRLLPSGLVPSFCSPAAAGTGAGVGLVPAQPGLCGQGVPCSMWVLAAPTLCVRARPVLCHAEPPGPARLLVPPRRPGTRWEQLATL